MFIERQKRRSKYLVLEPSMVHEEPFSYRVVHHGYPLMSCLGQTMVQNSTKLITFTFCQQKKHTVKFY